MNQRKDAVSTCDKVIAAAKAAMHSVVETARRTGTKIIVMRDGEIVHLSPDEVEISERPQGDAEIGKIDQSE